MLDKLNNKSFEMLVIHKELWNWITLTLKLAEGGFNEPPSPLGFFSLKFLPLDQLPNAFAQLFLDNEDIFDTN